MKFATRFVTGVAAAGLFIAAGSASAQATRYPEKPVRLVVGYSPGGLPDTIARLIAQKLTDKWGHQVIVENKPGANGGIGADTVAKSAPDGYALLVTDSSATAINPVLYQKLPYEPKDFAPVSLVARAPLYLAAHSSFPANSFKEAIELIKANPGKYTYGSSGIGSTHHLCMEYLKSTMNLDITHVPFKGTGQSVPALISGQVPMVWSAYPSLVAYAKDGRVKLLAVNSPKRSPSAPNIPAVSESIADFDFAPPIGILAPAATPKNVIAKIAADSAEAAKQPDVVQRLAALDIEAVGSSTEDYAKLLRADAERYARAVKASGARME